MDSETQVHGPSERKEVATKPLRAIVHCYRRWIAVAVVITAAILLMVSRTSRTKRVIAAAGAQRAGVITEFAGPDWLGDALDHVPRVKSLLETRSTFIMYFEQDDSRPIDLSYLKDAPYVETLIADEARGITDQDLSFIGRLKRLSSLSLKGPGITDAGVRHLSTLQTLEVLSISNAAFTDEGLVCLAGMPKLTSLLFYGSKAFNGDGLAHLPKECRLEDLRVVRTSFDHGLEHIDVTSLRRFSANRTPLSDSGLAPLRHAHALEHLTIAKTHVTDDGLSSLAGLKNLEILIVTGTQVTQAGTERLAEQLPRVAIAFGPNWEEPLWAYGSQVQPDSDESTVRGPATTD